VAFPFHDLTAPPANATLSVPLDTAASDGGVSPDTANIQVCLTTDVITHTEGSIDSLPLTDCKTSVPAEYVAAPAPHLQADLGPLLTKLPRATALVLLPDATKAGQSHAWRAVFSAHDRSDSAKTAEAAVAITLSDRRDEVTPAITPTESATPAAPTGSVSPLGADSTAAAPTPGAIAAPVEEPAAAPGPALATGASTTRFVGYAYPVVWLLPIVFLVALPGAARALTKDLTPQVGAR
jgi:hypothetical protein